MKNIRFDFTCSRQVPLYAHLCNQYLNYDALNITIGCDNQNHFGSQTYFIEAQGEQTQLEQLADAIAADFLISAWLIDSGIKVINESTGHKTLLPCLYATPSSTNTTRAIAPFVSNATHCSVIISQLNLASLTWLALVAKAKTC